MLVNLMFLVRERGTSFTETFIQMIPHNKDRICLSYNIHVHLF